MLYSLNSVLKSKRTTIDDVLGDESTDRFSRKHQKNQTEPREQTRFFFWSFPEQRTLVVTSDMCFANPEVGAVNSPASPVTLWRFRPITKRCRVTACVREARRSKQAQSDSLRSKQLINAAAAASASAGPASALFIHQVSVESLLSCRNLCCLSLINRR